MIPALRWALEARRDGRLTLVAHSSTLQAPFLTFRSLRPSHSHIGPYCGQGLGGGRTQEGTTSIR
jgi:hypothetical protein